MRRVSMARRAARLSFGLGLLLLVSCAARQKTFAGPDGASTTLRYRVELAADLRSMNVELCFRGAMFGGLVPGRAEAVERVRALSWLSGGGEGPVALEAGRIPIASTQDAGCLRYSVSLSEGGSLSALVTRVGENLVASPNVWLWRPALRPLKLTATLALALPPGVDASLPFVRLGTSEQGSEYQLPDSVFAFDSHAAFGHFHEHAIDEAGVHAHAAVLGSLRGLDDGTVDDWLRSAMRIASGSDGSFPAAALHVLVIPAGGGYEPFGSVARGGGASVLLFVPDSFDRERLARDWVLPHELSHLLLPFVRREDAWLAEGLATYYQEVLRARAGVIGADEALANIAQALRSAQHEGTGRSLCAESRTMHQTHAYRSVYWGGAGSLLEADLALRQQSAGKLTLDRLLARIRSEARMAPTYSASELLERMDALAGTHLFRDLGARCESAPFPDFEPSLRALGVDAQGRVRETAELASLRAQIFGPSEPALKPSPAQSVAK
jgi:hypothetical protein